MKKPKNYNNYAQLNNSFTPQEAAVVTSKLPPGVYELHLDTKGAVYFTMFETVHDKIIDLPTEEYTLLIKKLELFLEPSTKEAFSKYDFVYKFSALLYGIPGAGKTCIVNRAIDYAVSKGCVVLYNPHPQIAPMALAALTDIEPETTVLMVFEELDKLIARYEGDLLDLLDGETQRNAVMYIGTTNFINLIPPRILRSGRFSMKVEVSLPSIDARRFYLTQKLEASDVEAFLAASDSFTIDEVRTLIRDVKCLGQSLEDASRRILESKALEGSDTRGKTSPFRDDDGPDAIDIPYDSN